MKIFTTSLFAMLTNTLAAQSLPQDLDSILWSFGEKSPAAHALLVVEGGSVVYEHVLGLADVEQGLTATSTTNFRLASLSKQFTAKAIFLLEKQGKLNRQQLLTDFLPELAPIAKDVTLQHLLNHTSGLPDYENAIPGDRTAQLADADVPALILLAGKNYFTPGTGWRYSNTGYCLLALVVEKASGQSFSQFIENQLFAPLEMSNSRVYESGINIPDRAYGYALDEKGRTRFSDQSITSATKGDGGIYTSLTDFEKWASSMDEDYLSILSSSSANLPDLPSCYYGLGWFWVKKKGLPLALFHSGSTCGFSNMVVQVPERKLIVVFLTNLADNNEAFAPVYDALVQAGTLPPNLDIWQLYLQTR